MQTTVFVVIIIIAVAVMLGGKAAIALLMGTILWLSLRGERVVDVAVVDDTEPTEVTKSCPPIDVYADTDPFETSDPAVTWPYRGEHKPTVCYDPPIKLPSSVQGHIDDLVTEMAAARSRDRRAIDGALTKTADYYKRHYGDELDQSEAKVWWGKNDW